MQACPVISLSPSFNSYSNSNFAEIAARVVDEFDSDEVCGEDEEENSEYVEKERTDDDEGEEFEFVTSDSELSTPISADEIFDNGKIRPVYPIFNRDLLLGHMKITQNEKEKENGVRNSAPTFRLPLRKLFIEERETTMTTSTTSSSEADELDGLPAETYCVWRPKTAAEREEEEDESSEKNSSGGANSKKWKFRDLLLGSNSDGSKGSFVFSTPARIKENEKKVKETPASGGKMKSPPPPCIRDSGEKHRSYLPYGQDLVGFFAL